MEGICFYARMGFLKSVSIVDLKGNVATGHAGLIDLMLYKGMVRFAMIKKGLEMFGLESLPVIDPHMAGWSDWLRRTEVNDHSWCSRGTPAQQAFAKFFSEVIFGCCHDNMLKESIKKGMAPEEASDAILTSNCALLKECSRGGGAQEGLGSS